jgi:hypothetical protein
MGPTFSGPNAFKFIGFTPAATAVLQRSPFLLAAVVIVLVACISLGLLTWYIHFITNKPYKKPKAVKDGKK